jgi:hypothetical protein
MSDRIWQERPIQWQATGDPHIPYAASDGDRVLQLRLGDFPAEELYTLLVDGVDVLSFSEWPNRWGRGNHPGASG